MARQAAWILAAAVASAVPASASPVALCEQTAESEQRTPQTGESGKDHQKPAQGRRPLKFWQGETKAELGITNQQSTEIEQIFRANLPKLEASKDKLDKLEAALSQTIRDNTADLATVAQQVDRVESVRADLYKTRTLMLYRMRGVLSADQRAKLKQIMDRADAARRKSSDQNDSKGPKDQQDPKDSTRPDGRR
jgi:Spy/CpxP family protein refolding chaperone